MATESEARAAGFNLPNGQTDDIRTGDDAIKQNALAAVTGIAEAKQAATAVADSVSTLSTFKGTNLLPDGMFAKADASGQPVGWLNYGSTTTMQASVAISTGNGSLGGVGIYTAPSARFTGIGGHRYYVRARIRTTVTAAAFLAVSLSDGTTHIGLDGAAQTVTKPGLNAWYNVGGTVTLPVEWDGKQISTWLRGFYPSAAAANGNGLEVYRVAVVDLTETYGAGKEPPGPVVDSLLGSVVSWTGSRALETTQAAITRPMLPAAPRRHRTQYTTPTVVLRFDDGYRAVWEHALPLLNRYGMTGVMATCTDPVNWLSAPDQKGHGPTMTPAQLLDLHRAGWEIASHTRTHTDATTLTPTEFAADLDQSAADLVSMGLPRPDTFAYPNGSHNPITDRLVYRRYRRCMITGGPEATPVDPSQPVFFTGWATIPGTDPYKAGIVARAKAYVEEAFRVGRVPVLGFHTITREPDAWAPAIDLPTFTALIQWLHAEGYPVANMRDIGRPHNLISDPGFNSYPLPGPAGWGSFPWMTVGAGGNLAWKRSTTGQESGSACITLDATSGIASGLAIEQRVAVVEGQRYRLRVRANITSAQTGSLEVRVSFFDFNLRSAGPDAVVSTLTSPTDGFTDLVGEFVAPTSTTARIRIGSGPTGFTGAGVVDHVQLIPTSTFDPLA